MKTKPDIKPTPEEIFISKLLAPTLSAVSTLVTIFTAAAAVHGASVS